MKDFYKRKYLYIEMLTEVQPEKSLEIVHIVYCEIIGGFDTCQTCLLFGEKMGLTTKVFII